ncbi:MAG: EamA family transporter [Bacteroidales bacterium]|nr:EamA family transporter [Bacteroidales bacterium]
MKTNNKLIGHIAIFLAYSIFGFNNITCKNLVSFGVVSPIGIFFLRALGATICFWLVSLFLPKEKVDKKDLPKIFLASMLGLFLTQMSFLKAMIITTPVDAAIITTLTPIFTMFIAAIFLKEPITFKKAGGVALSFIGVILLILNSVHTPNGVEHSHPLGLCLMICNCLFFALYLGAFRPLVQKYGTITFMKWMFLFSMLIAIPFNIKEMITTDYTLLTSEFMWNLAFTVICATFIAYFLVPIGQKNLRPTIVSMYAYVQPFIASIVSIIIGMDAMTWQKILAAILVFTGVFLVNKSKAKDSQ